MRLSRLLRDLDVLETNVSPDTEISDVCYDSRKVGKGSLFVAVVGYNSDGHGFIPMAMEKGAACILCQTAPGGTVPFVRVADTRKALAVVSANFFGNPAEKMIMIGVTGTNGKTTTTTLIKSMLERTLGAKVGLIGTNQNLIGTKTIPTERTTPESRDLQELFAQMAEEGCTHVVMEVSSHALFLDRVYGVPFTVGVFTNLTQDHLDFHKTMDAYARAKALLFQRCRYGCVNVDDAYAPVMMEQASCSLLRYSAQDSSADLYADRISLDRDSVSFDGHYLGQSCRVKLPIPGLFSAYNAMSALSACLCLGVGFASAVQALAACHGVMGRAEVVPTDRDFTVIIDYAHTPDALENILKTVRAVTAGRVVCLFGCGGDRDRTKRPKMGDIASRLADFVVVTSDNPRTEEPDAIIREILAGMEGTHTPYTVIENRKSAIGWALDHAQKGDVIVLAGKGHETYQIIGTEKHHFDEREVIAEHLAEGVGK